MGLLFCRCEKGAERGTRQSIVYWWMQAELSVRLLRVSGSPRACSPRDHNTLCHSEEDGRTTRQSIVFRESERGWRFGCEGQWIATPQEARDEKRELRDGAVRLLRVSGSPRAFSPRDDKVGWFHHEGSEVIGAFTLSLRGGSGARDAAIHRVQGRADGFGGSVTGSQWIATGFQPSR
jgi:hypothetical protein